MRDQTICNVWARIPGLNDYWCYQIQWRIGIDEEVLAALTEPRYPVPLALSSSSSSPPSLDTIILVQTIYLCQLFLHLQEFDPSVAPEQHDGEEELVRVFQDSLAREFNNNAPPPQRDDGPAPDGETLERVVLGLMKAQRDEQAPSPEATAATTTTTTEEGEEEEGGGGGGATPNEDTSSLQQLLVRILAELNRPLFDKARRYEEVFGPRTDETWAARFATRVMQWRWCLRPPSRQLTEDLIRVFPHDVHPLDDEGLQVYRMVRNAAPGRIHLVTPLGPSLQPRPGQERPRLQSRLRRQRLSSSSSSSSSLSSVGPGSLVLSRVSSTMPRTPPPPPPPPPLLPPQTESTGAKRGSTQDAQGPPSKRPRSSKEGDTADQLLWRVLERVEGLGRQIDGMQQDLGQRFNQLDDRLQHIEAWISDEV